MKIIYVTLMATIVTMAGNQQLPGFQIDGSDTEVRFYDVGDLLSGGVNHGFSGLKIPGGDAEGSDWSGRRTGTQFLQGGMGGGFGGPGAAGGGSFAIPEGVIGISMGPGAQVGPGVGGIGNGAIDGVIAPEVDMEVIYDVIEGTDPEAFGSGDASIEILGRLMMIRQTVDGHQKISRLLDDWRLAAFGGGKQIGINAWWIFAKREEIEAALKSADNSRHGIANLPQDIVFHQMVAASTRKEVHVIGGNLITGVESVIPVVGQTDGTFLRGDARIAEKTRDGGAVSVRSINFPVTESVAQFENRGDRKTGYQPVVGSMVFGSLLQISAEQDRNGNGFMAKFHNIVVLPTSSGSSGQASFLEGITLNSKDLIAQQFSSETFVGESGKCRIVGGGALQTGKPDLGECWLVLMIE